ncbi:MAG: glycoside hydrolase family 9 protein [Polyangiaceae bacterium]|nr:glycoside hydrolase family 9 protein [Polyangiaceae bacterium]
MAHLPHYLRHFVLAFGFFCSLSGCEEPKTQGVPWRPYYGCPSGSLNCGGECLPVLTDNNNCGECGRVCATGASCTNGTCTCPIGVSCTGGVVPMSSNSPTSPTAAPMGAPSGTTTTSAPTTTTSSPLPKPPIDNTPGIDSTYETVLRLAVHFYGAQRAGTQPNWLLRQVNGGGQGCFTADGKPYGVDLSGGWFDAGDHIKPTLTISYAALLLLKAYEAFPNAFDDLYGPTDAAPLVGASISGTPNGIPDVLDEVKAATDYLEKIVVNGSLVMQVGNTELDHRRFYSCPAQANFDLATGGEMQGATRIGREVSLGNGGAAGGLAAASLALMAQLYAPFDPTAASRYLAAATAIYPLVSEQAMGVSPYPGSKPAVGKLCAAAELLRTTKGENYRADTLRLLGSTGPHYWVAGWDNPHEFCLQSAYVATDDFTALAKWSENLNLGISQEANVRGLILKPDWGDWGVLRNATTAGFSAALLGHLRKTTDYQALAKSQLDWVLGQNPTGRSYVVGIGTNPPRSPHHRNACEQEASGPNDSVGCKHLLYGALVSGPSVGRAYADNVSDYVQNEVALDYNAGLVGLAAYAVYLERGGN